MMRYACILIVVVVCGDAATAGCKNCMQAMSKEERAMFRAHSDACLPQSNVEQSLIEAMFNGDIRDTPALRKHVYCVLMKCKVVGKDGKLHKSAILGKMARVGGKNATKVLEACFDQTGDTPEDLAWNLFRCGYDKKAVLFEFMPNGSASGGDSENDN
uniref:Putative odorant binding protein 21 n=1 Tax=Conopomorpha sinensis TaxID=940481 RepID=A0A649ZUD4_9NEOP|nr:putative odorant binding protein 21 [Conopomorpha sinensis]